MTYQLTERDLAYVDEVVASFPPLSSDQRNRLSMLLNAPQKKKKKERSVVERLAEGIWKNG